MSSVGLSSAEYEFEYPDGASYSGEWNSRGQKHGYGAYCNAKGDLYIGRFENDLYRGLGLLRAASGCWYAGEWMAGWMHGHGIFQATSGARYEGQFRAGRILGYGLTSFASPTAESEYLDPEEDTSEADSETELSDRRHPLVGKRTQRKYWCGMHNEYGLVRPESCARVLASIELLCEHFGIDPTPWLRLELQRADE